MRGCSRLHAAAATVRSGGDSAEQPPSPVTRLRGTPLAWLHERCQPVLAASGCCGDGASAAGVEISPDKTSSQLPSVNKGARKPASKKERSGKRAALGAAGKRRAAEPVPSAETAVATTERDERCLELERALEFMSAQLREARAASAEQQAAFEAERERHRQEAAANARWISQLCAEIQRLRAAAPCASSGDGASASVGSAEISGTLRRSFTNRIV